MLGKAILVDNRFVASGAQFISGRFGCCIFSSCAVPGTVGSTKGDTVAVGTNDEGVPVRRSAVGVNVNISGGVGTADVNKDPWCHVEEYMDLPTERLDERQF